MSTSILESIIGAEILLIPPRLRAKLDQHLEEEQQRLLHAEGVLKHSPAHILTLTPDGRVLTANHLPTGATMAIGENILSYVPENSRETMRAALSEAQHKIVRHNFPLLTNKGEMWYGAISGPCDGENSGQVVLNAVNITRLRSATEALQESEAKYRSLFNNFPVPAAVTDLDGLLIEANAAFYELLGYTFEEMAGTSMRQYYVHPSERVKLIESLERDGKATASVELKRKDGTLLNTSVTAVVEYDSTLQTKIIRGTIMDHTKHLKLQEEYFHAQKMEAVGRLAGGVAHDFNNLLTAMKGHTELLIDDPNMPNQYRDDLKTMLRASQRAAEVTRQLLAFSRKQVLQPETFSLNDIVDENRKLMGRLIGEDITVEADLSPRAGYVHADRGQLNQILMNLTVNARDAMPEGGRLKYSTGFWQLPESEGDLQPGNYAIIEVSDTGHGIPAEAVDRIFEPFYTTKELGKGTGLGLSTVYGIVKQSRGTITVESQPGNGTTFRVYLPQVTPEHRIESNTHTTHRGEGKILLVEDDETVRNLTHRILSRAGYEVSVASNGIEALAAAKHSQYDLVITDMVMPQMSGPEMLREVRSLQPDARTLVMSGHLSEDVQNYTLEPGTPYLQKPFSVSKLTKAVKDALNG